MNISVAIALRIWGSAIRAARPTPKVERFEPIAAEYAEEECTVAISAAHIDISIFR
ncbi:hypothetical protein [Nocardia nepalensis]|uniref:hypothetical protein n=1 Tax=Nocardia nepalensis TaxID=3375448 RepID=UPI003B67212C